MTDSNIEDYKVQTYFESFKRNIFGNSRAKSLSTKISNSIISVKIEECRVSIRNNKIFKFQ